MRDTLKVQNIYVKNYQNENVNNNGSKIKTMFLAPNNWTGLLNHFQNKQEENTHVRFDLNLKKSKKARGIKSLV